MYVVLTLLSLLPVLVIGRVLGIHLTDGAELREQGARQHSARVEIPAMRGSIRDRAGRALAVNTARYDIALDPTVPGFSPTVANTFFERLSKLTGRPAGLFRRKVEERSSPQYVLLLRDLPESQKEELDTWDVPGLIMTAKFARRYNYGETAAHVLGHVGSDGQGLAGLELQYDDMLRGQPGYRAVKRDRLGKIRAYVQGQVVEPQHGETLVLTIDLIRQTIMEEELARGVAESGARWGTAIAMDPRSGAILAMADVPTYDPNRPAAAPVAARRNRAITDRIEPGSTFKLVTAVAALERGVTTLTDSIETGAGWAVFGGRTMKDTHAHGTITFADVIARSSNVGTAKTAAQIDRGIFYQYARNFGFGQPTWIDLPGEVAGVLKKPSAWSGTTLTSMSIGYEVAATPLQVLAAYGALANGGLLVQPYVVAKRLDVKGQTIWRARQDSVRRAFERETAERLLPAFERAVQEGTATRAQVPGLRIAGKTGTAYTASGGSYDRTAYRASFVGFFPADDPAVALIVVLDDPSSAGGYGGAVAAPIFQRIAKRWIGTFPKIAEQMAPEAELPKAPERPLPDVTGRPAAIASRQMLAAGYRAALPDDRDALHPVVEQRPRPGTPAEPGDRARLTLAETAEPPETMPDLTGLSARNAVFWLAARGVGVKVEGRGRVVSQSPRAGAEVPAVVVLRCN